MFLLIRENLVVPWKHAKEAVGRLLKRVDVLSSRKEKWKKPAVIQI